MPDSTDTRDRVIRIETKLEHLSDLVEKNSVLLKTLNEASLRQNGGVAAFGYAIDAIKLVGSGGAGAAILAGLQHWLPIMSKAG
jgi:hypothetical protein